MLSDVVDRVRVHVCGYERPDPSGCVVLREDCAGSLDLRSDSRSGGAYPESVRHLDRRDLGHDVDAARRGNLARDPVFPSAPDRPPHCDVHLHRVRRPSELGDGYCGVVDGVLAARDDFGSEPLLSLSSYNNLISYINRSTDVDSRGGSRQCCGPCVRRSNAKSRNPEVPASCILKWCAILGLNQ